MKHSFRGLVGSALLIVACGSDLNEGTTGEPPESIPGAQGGSRGAGTGGAVRADNVRADGGASADADNTTEPSGESLGAGGGSDESEVLELDPNWTPADLTPEAWYVASPNDYLVNVSANTATWRDRMFKGHDLTQAVAWAPELEPSGWDGIRPTVHFNGSKLMNASWSGTEPIGTNAGFTVLAVMRSDVPQYAGIASWWSEWGDGVWANIRSTSELTLLDYHRLDDGVRTQMYVGNQDLGTTGHSVVWRFSPSTQTVTLTVDGAHAVSSPQPPVGAITAMPLIVGAMSPLPTGFFLGDISELVIVPRPISDAEVQYFTEYAVNTWWNGDPPPAGSGPCIKGDGTHSPLTMRCDDGNPETFGDHCSAGSCVGAVPGPGSPKDLSPVAWYHAGESEVVNTWGGVSTWFDRSPQHRDLMNGYWFRPTVYPLGWNGNKPTVTFTAPNALKRLDWVGPPTGTESAFTVLAVLRPNIGNQNGGVVSWWNTYGYGQAACQITPSGSSKALDLFREDDFLVKRESVGTIDLGAERHAVAWRYENGIVKFTVDGVTQAQAQAPIGSIPTDSFLMGVANGFGTGAFGGDISELAVIPRSISDTEVAKFNEYAQGEWGGLNIVCSPDCAGRAHGADNGCGGTCGCEPNAPFDAPIPAFTGTMNADGLTFSADNLTAYISGVGTGGYDIFVATRPSLMAPFSTPAQLPDPINTPAAQRAPSLAPDGSLYLTNAPNGWRDISQSTRPSGLFGVAQPITVPEGFNHFGMVHDQDPFWWGPTPQGTHLLLFASERPDGAHRDLYSATLTGSTLSMPQKIAGALLNTDFEDFRPVLAPDGLTLYFASKRHGIGSDTDGDVFVARRTAINQAFLAPTNVLAMNSTGAEFPVAVSRDGCSVYFASNEEMGLNGDNYRLYEAKRGTSTPAQVSVQLNIIGTGNITLPAMNCGPGMTGQCTLSGPPGGATIVTASGLAQWTGICAGNGGPVSSDGVVVFAKNGICTVKFGNPPLVPPGGPCSLTMDCLQGLCTNGTCGCAPGTQCAGPGEICSADSDCTAGHVCGPNNGACFGGARAERRCWPAQCLDGIDETSGACGQPNSPCGSACGCGTPCSTESPTNTCTGGEVCIEDFGRLIGIPSRDACGPSVCPSNDPALCGDDSKLCGRSCVSTPNCSNATPANPGDGFGGHCPGVCPTGLVGCCREDVDCQPGDVCLADSSGSRTCRPADKCANRVLRPPLCGSPDSDCGELCPSCTPQCGARVCGPDPNCGENCGTCSSGYCDDASGQCRDPKSIPPVTVPDGQGGQRDVPDLPPVAAAPVGVIPGTFAVTEQGTAQYVLPIEVPPGRASMTPALSLVYSASRDSGSLGVGWRLEGLPKITRCPRTFAVDGAAAAVKNDIVDAFCLDGKRLMPVPGTIGLQGTEYRTLIDSFAKIKSRVESNSSIQRDLPANAINLDWTLQGPDSFEVRTKDGRIMTFGGTLDSLVIGHARRGTDSRYGVRQTWLLRTIEDRSGNKITYSYDNYLAAELADGSRPTLLHPRVITYTGHGSDLGNREVRFDYEPRERELRFLHGGVPWSLEERLKQITTYVDRVPVKNYRLQYAQREFSQLELVRECEGATQDRCKFPTRFEYERSPGFEFVHPGPGSLGTGELDVDGNGLPDYLETTVNVEGASANPDLAAAKLVTDIGVAALTTFLQPEVGIPVSIFYALTGSSIFGLLADDEPEITISHALRINTGVRGANFPSTSADGIPCNFTNSFQDYDRDGRDDILCSPHGTDISVGLSRGDGSFQQRQPAVEMPDLPPIPTRNGGSFPSPQQQIPLSFDIDGDGLADIISCHKTNAPPAGEVSVVEVRRRLNAIGGFAPPVRMQGPCGFFQTKTKGTLPRFSPATLAVFDIDGDGTPDLLTRNPVPAAGSGAPDRVWQVLRYEVDTGGTPRLAWEDVRFANVGLSHFGKGVQLGDFNRDGLVDVLRIDGGQMTIWRNSGAGTFLPSNYTRPLLAGRNRRKTALVDFDDDGRLDLLEHWQLPDRTICGSGMNMVLFTRSDLSGLDTELDPDAFRQTLRPTCGDEALPGEMAADFDGDGNVDLHGRNHIFYGRGAHNLLLTRVEDGFGNVTTVHYDKPVTADGRPTYETTATCAGATWPEMCLKRVSGLVAEHTQGFRPISASFPVAQRRYRYTYSNARVSATGHGWFGFDQRTIRETTLSTSFLPEGAPTDNETPETTTTITMEPVTPIVLAGGSPTDTPRSIYPLAGLPRTIVTERSKQRSPIETAAHRRRSVVTNQWGVGVSVAGFAFPRLQERTTWITEAEVSAPPEEVGQLLSHCEETFVTDDYGNVRDHSESCDDEGTRTQVSIIPNPDTWLISNPEFITVESRLSGSPQQVQTQRVQNWDLDYFPNGLLSSITRSPTGLASEMHVTTYVPNAFGNVEVVTETAPGEAARVTTITYDDDNVFPRTVTKTVANQGQRTQVSFDRGWGTLRTTVDPNGILVQNIYDGLGLLSETRDPLGTTVYSYAWSAREVSTTVGQLSPRLKLTIERQGTNGTRSGALVREFDNRGLLVLTQSEGLAGAAVVSERAYDSRGRLFAATTPHLSAAAVVPRTFYAYDGLDRLKRVVRPGATGFVEIQHASSITLVEARRHWLNGTDCGEGDLSCPTEVQLTIDEEGRKDVVLRNRRGLITRNIDGENVDQLANAMRSWEYRYGAFNRLRKIKHNDWTGSAPGRPTEFVYDAYGRLLSHTDPDTGTATFTYTGFDDLKDSFDPKGQVRTFTHDQLGRRTSIADAAGTMMTQWSYDQGVNAVGRISETISPPTAEAPQGQHIVYSYEPQGANNRGLLKRLDYIIDSSVYPIEFGYDDLGRTETIEYPDLSGGNPVIAKYSYDTSGVLTDLEEIGGEGAPQPIWHLNSVFDGQLVQRETFGDGANTSYTYHPQRRHLESILTGFNGGFAQDIRYTHFNNGRVHHRIENVTEMRTFVYDQVNRLAATFDAVGSDVPTTTLYDYDRFGNLTQRGTAVLSYSPTQHHLLESVDGNGYLYDLNGNVRRREGPSVPGSLQTIEYTPFDLPGVVTTGSGEGAQTTKFEYSANERRLVRRDTGPSLDRTRHFAAELYQRVVDNNASATIEERFRLFAGGREVAQIVRANGDERTLYFHADHLGTPDMITTSDGDVIFEEFDPFGRQIDVSATDVTRTGFTGHEHDFDIGFIDMKGRIYDPLAARFTTPDPMMQAPFWSQGLNRYTYVFNDPVNHTDPSGFLADAVGSGSVGFPAVLLGSGMYAGLASPYGFIAGGIGALNTLFGPGVPGGGSPNRQVSMPGGSAAPTSNPLRSSNASDGNKPVQPPAEEKIFPYEDPIELYKLHPEPKRPPRVPRPPTIEFLEVDRIPPTEPRIPPQFDEFVRRQMEEMFEDDTKERRRIRRLRNKHFLEDVENGKLPNSSSDRIFGIPAEELEAIGGFAEEADGALDCFELDPGCVETLRDVAGREAYPPPKVRAQGSGD